MPECCPHMQRRIKEQAECVLSGIQYLKENNKNKSSIFKVFGMKTINSCLGVCISSVSLRFTSQYGQLPWYLMVNDLLLPQHLSFGPGHACPRVPCRRVAGARQGNARVQAPPRKDAIMDYFHASKAVAALGLLDEKSKGFEITVCLWVFFLKTTVCMLQWVCYLPWWEQWGHVWLSSTFSRRWKSRVSHCAEAYESYFCVPIPRPVLNKELKCLILALRVLLS